MNLATSFANVYDLPTEQAERELRVQLGDEISPAGPFLTIGN